VHLLAVSGVAQAVVTVLAVVDGSHHIQVRSHGRGTVLVLSHDQEDSPCRQVARHLVGHSHSRVVRTIMLLAQPVRGDQAHVFALTAAASQFSRAADRLVERPQSSPIDVELPAFGRLPHELPQWRPFPTRSGIPSLPLLVVESVVLLI